MVAPKERHASLFSVQAAVAEAVVCFNVGNQQAFSQILSELSINSGLHNIKMMAEDRRRTAQSVRKRASAENVRQALKKWHTGQNEQSDYMPGAY